jgi:hypothetical protein
MARTCKLRHKTSRRFGLDLYGEVPINEGHTVAFYSR